MYKKELGKWGEELACKYLVNNNYNVIERNYYCRQGEIDIIAKDLKRNEIIFIEVKTRTGFMYGFPADAIDYSKRVHIKKCAEYYLYKKKLNGINVRFDAIEIVVNKGVYKLNHIKQISV